MSPLDWIVDNDGVSAVWRFHDRDLRGGGHCYLNTTPWPEQWEQQLDRQSTGAKFGNLEKRLCKGEF